ncbi:MAG: ABC transporter permease, partial [Microbacterium sp.]|nr:ABC transporter permease [Microbacterium sp.]
GRPAAGGGMSDTARSSSRLPRLPAVPMAILVGVLLGGLLVLVSGGNPFTAYLAIVTGSLSWSSLPNTLNWAVPLVGMTLVAAIPLRGGMINLGGDGQMVVGGLVAALVPLYLPGPGWLLILCAILAAMIAAGLYATLAAWGETRHGIPMSPRGSCSSRPRSTSRRDPPHASSAGSRATSPWRAPSCS